MRTDHRGAAEAERFRDEKRMTRNKKQTLKGKKGKDGNMTAAFSFLSGDTKGLESYFQHQDQLSTHFFPVSLL